MLWNTVKITTPDGDATIVICTKVEVVRLGSNNICMHDYHYHYGIVCTIITMTLFICKTMILFLW
jgi:hypothetical protein